jgi:hypothetical protein
MARSFGKMPTTSVRRLISLFNRSIAWSQYTFSPSRAAERDHVADLHVLAIHHDAIDQQFDEGTSLAEVRVFEAFADDGSKVFDVSGQALQMVALQCFGFEYVLVACKLSKASFELTAPCLEFLERQSFRLVGIHQALDAALDLSASAAEVAPMCLALLAAEPAIAKPLHCILEHCRFAEQLTEVVPDEGVNPRRGYLASVARLSAPSIRQNVHPTAAVVGVSPVVPDVHRQPAPAAAEQPAQQILTACVAGGPLLITL